MSDEIMQELWQIKDRIAREHGYDIEVLVAHLQSNERSGDQKIVDLQTTTEDSERGDTADALTSRG